MQSPQDSLIQEATSLFRLVESVDRFVAEHENLFAYTEATQAFFLYVHDQAEVTRNSASERIQRLAQAQEQAVPRYRRELIIHKDRWRTLHTYVKPATDAHTLNLPAPLIQMATEDLQRIPGMEGTAIVVLLTPELMYYHNTPQSKAQPQLAFVEVPYSQGPGFFTNLTIYHELGHYVYDRLADADDRNPAFKALAAAMDRAFDGMFDERLRTPSTRTWARRVLDAWTKEIFCDLFALRHLGPAFSFALIDILSLIGLMEEETEAKFDVEHPATAVRLREQLTLLRNDGWWAQVQDLQSEHVSLIMRLAGKSESEYFFEFREERLPAFTGAFLTIVPFIHALVSHVTPHCKGAPEDFRRRRPEIEDCFLHGVVPSKLLAQGEVASPTPVSIINAAYCFYLTLLPKLMNRLKGQETYNLRHRKKWIEKLESWTMKGIEDHQLLTASRAAYQ
jgi:hypothetical protein